MQQALLSKDIWGLTPRRPHFLPIFMSSMESSEQSFGRFENVFLACARFTAIYEITAGCVKTVGTFENGREQITGFYLPGDLMGLDAIDSGKYVSDGRAVVDSRVRAVAYSEFERLCRTSTSFQHQFHREFGIQLARGIETMFMLGTLLAEQRMAAFLLDMAQRMARPVSNFQSPCVHLCMTRQEIGSYLGLTIETVSRTLSHLKDAELVDLSSTDRREIQLLDVERLRHLVIGETQSSRGLSRSGVGGPPKAATVDSSLASKTRNASPIPVMHSLPWGPDCVTRESVC